jgi:hypothetical protein
MRIQHLKLDIGVEIQLLLHTRQHGPAPSIASSTLRKTDAVHGLRRRGGAARQPQKQPGKAPFQNKSGYDTQRGGKR